MVYVLDGIVLAVVLSYAVVARRKGFIRAALGFLPMLAALVGTKLFSPTIDKFLRGTPIFDLLANSIGNSMGLEEAIHENAIHTQTELIEGLKLPAFIKEALLENNNPVIYHLLDVQSLKEYIAGYLANICINILGVILAFAVIFLAVKMLLNAMNLISKLPGLNFFNRACGLLVGGAKGLCIVWLGCAVLTFFQCHGKFIGLFQALDASHVAKIAYENNILLRLILTIFT